MTAVLDPFDSAGESSSLAAAEAHVLIERARGGCNEALNQLIGSLQGYLLLIANQELNTDLQAKLGASDLVQSVLVRAQQNLADFRGQSRQTLLAWLRKILHHEIIAAHRRFVLSDMRSVDREVDLPLDSGLTSPLADPGRSPPSHAARNEDAWRLRSAIERLPEDYRAVVILRNWEQRPFDEIGQQMDRSTDAVKKLWTRAIRQLEKELRDE